LDYFVSNAGAATLSPVVDMPEEDFNHVLAVDLKGPFLFMKAVARSTAETTSAGCTATSTC
jgi:glucose 1-dehydrogenase